MLDARGYEYEVAGFELLSTATVKQTASAAHTDIDLSLRVRVWRFGDTGSESNARYRSVFGSMRGALG